MAATVTVRAKLTSKIGFYIGDVCYEMTDEDYYADWSNNFEDFEGEHELRGHKFAIGGTAYGDGEYEDQYGHRYGVDSGTIGILPYELCKDKNISELDRYGRFVRATSATFTAEDGEFDIKLNTQQSYHISTNDYEEDEEDDYYEMTDEDYYADWSNNFEDFEGEHELRGHKFAIGGTAYGDGEYEDQYGHRYGVDSGTIGILPYELCKDKNISELDRYGRFVRATSATFTAEDGEFDIKLNTQQSYHISTNDYEEDEEDDYYDDEDYDYYYDSDEEDED